MINADKCIGIVNGLRVALGGEKDWRRLKRAGVLENLDELAKELNRGANAAAMPAKKNRAG